MTKPDLSPFIDSLLAMPKFGPVMKSVALNPEDTKQWERREVLSPVETLMGVPVTFDPDIPLGVGRVTWTDGSTTMNPTPRLPLAPSPDTTQFRRFDTANEALSAYFSERGGANGT